MRRRDLNIFFRYYVLFVREEDCLSRSGHILISLFCSMVDLWWVKAPKLGESIIVAVVLEANLLGRCPPSPLRRPVLILLYVIY